MKEHAPDYVKIGNRIGELVKQKNMAYGDSFSRATDILEVLYPRGIEAHQYRDMLAVIRVIDKLFRLATRKHAFDESPWNDIAGYALLGIVADEKDSLAAVEE
jgi:hypothetical protein